MAWVTPSNRSTGDIVTAAIWNQDAVYNPQYLKGQAGAVTIEDEVAFENDANFLLRILSSNPLLGFDNNDYLRYVRASDAFEFIIGGAQKAMLQSTGVWTTALGKLLQSKQNQILVEYKNSSVSRGGAGTYTQSITWDNAFSSIVTCIHGAGITDSEVIDSISTFSWSTTGASLKITISGNSCSTLVNFLGIGT